MRIILIFSVVFLFYFLQREIYIRKCFDKVSANLKFDCSEVFKGEALKLTLTITNKKFIPLWWIGVKYDLSRGISYFDDSEAEVSKDNYRKDVFFMLPYERLTKSYDIKAVKRGYYNIEQIELNSGDLFSDTRMLKKISNGSELYVYPRLISTEQMDIVFNKINGEVITRRNLIEDPFQLRGIREYNSFDSMKNVNWKATARSSQLKVNQYESTCSGGVTILLNVEKFNDFDDEELIEESISIAASISAKFINQGINVEVISNGADVINGSKIMVQGASTLNKNIEIYEALSLLHIGNTKVPLIDLINEEITLKRKDRIILLISHYYKNDIIEEYMEKQMQGFSVKWILPKKDDKNLPPEGIEQLYLWEVQY